MPSERTGDSAWNNRDAWGPVTCALVGVWLLGGPAAMGYLGESIALSDFASGAAAIALALFALRGRRRAHAEWLLCMLGVWLLHAPLVFWTTSPAAYLNSTVAGVGLIVFSVVLPRRIWRGHPLDPRAPPGWTFNPSSWAQRAPIITLAWINFLLARYLAAYQLEHTGRAWDPLFGDGTERVLGSDISEAFPVSDAGLGAAAYMIEALIGFMGAASRWRTAPWTVALFGVLVIPVGVVSTVLMILQPVAVGAWCTICLITASLMIVMACLALPEVVAMLQCLARARNSDRGVWRTFWLGANSADDPAADRDHRPSMPKRSLFDAMTCGTTAPPGLVLSLLIGVWFVAAPGVFGLDGLAMNAHVIAGALVIVVSVMAMSEPIRPVRLLNIPIGASLAIGVWFFDGATTTAQIGAAAGAALLIGASLPRGAVRQRYGEWDRLIR